MTPIGELVNRILANTDRVRELQHEFQTARSGIIEKACDYLRKQPHGTDEQLARQIGVEPATVREARRMILDGIDFDLPVRKPPRKSGRKHASNGAYERAREAILANPTATGKYLASIAKCGETTASFVRRRLKSEGLI